MPAQTTTCPTPRYVLHEDKQPIGPNVIQDRPGLLAIYGFSGKAAYDQFAADSERDLRPYPLMKGYLQNRLAEEQQETFIMIIDANGPVADSVSAATLENVLAAQTKDVPQLSSDFQLTFSPANNGYTLTEQAT